LFTQDITLIPCLNDIHSRFKSPFNANCITKCSAWTFLYNKSNFLLSLLLSLRFMFHFPCKIRLEMTSLSFHAWMTTIRGLNVLLRPKVSRNVPFEIFLYYKSTYLLSLFQIYNLSFIFHLNYVKTWLHSNSMLEWYTFEV
jgi:hypothetical protein